MLEPSPPRPGALAPVFLLLAAFVAGCVAGLEANDPFSDASGITADNAFDVTLEMPDDPPGLYSSRSEKLADYRTAGCVTAQQSCDDLAAWCLTLDGELFGECFFAAVSCAVPVYWTCKTGAQHPGLCQHYGSLCERTDRWCATLNSAKLRSECLAAASTCAPREQAVCEGETVPTDPPPPPPPPTTSGPVALTLNANTTGVVGGVRSGDCAGDANRPYANLDVTNGTVTIDKDGTVLENFDIRGGIVINADNVTLRCGRVSGNNPYTINVRSGKNHRFEWVEAHQDDDGKTILGGNYTAYRCDVHGGEDSVHINTGTVAITECYIHDQNFIGPAHPDCIQATTAGRVVNVVVRRSKLISFYKAPNAAFQINVADAWSIRDSYLWGGAYSILGDPGATGQVHDNFFGWDSSQFGAIGGVRANRSGNVWWEWSDPRCASGRYSASSCRTPGDHPGNGTPIE